MEGVITTRQDYAIGQTLDISLNQKPNPFTNDSQKQFNNAFDTKLTQFKHELNESKTCIDAHGEFNMYSTLVQNQSEKAKALGIRGKLDFSYGPVSGDAYVQFAMDNIQGALQLTMIVRGNQSGRIVKNIENAFLPLQLRQCVLNKIQNGNYKSIDDFKREYGSHLIFGFDYGGRILFESTYSTNSSSDKMSVAGGLSLSYGKMGFNISGSVEGDYKSEDIKKSTNITTKYTIKPSYNDPLINGKNGIIELLQKISNPLMLENNMNNNISADLYSKMQKVLGGKVLDPVNAIIRSIESIGCVNDAFSAMDMLQNSVNIKSFFKFANPLYSSMKEILYAMNTITENYDKYDKNNKPTNEIILWLRLLNIPLRKMETIHGAQLYEYAEKWYAYTQSVEENDDEHKDELEIKKDFYKINKDVLSEQFKHKLLNPYNGMMDNTEDNKEDNKEDYKEDHKEDVFLTEIYDLKTAFKIPNSPHLYNLYPLQLTVSFWCKPMELNRYQTIMSTEPLDSTRRTYGWGFRFRSDGVFWFNIMTGHGYGSELKSRIKLTQSMLNIWYHICGVYDGSNGKKQIYVNGILENTGTVDRTRYPLRFTANSCLQIGSLINYGEKFNGVIADVVIYGKLLTNDEIKMNVETLTVNQDNNNNNNNIVLQSTDLIDWKYLCNYNGNKRNKIWNPTIQQNTIACIDFIKEKKQLNPQMAQYVSGNGGKRFTDNSDSNQKKKKQRFQ